MKTLPHIQSVLDRQRDSIARDPFKTSGTVIFAPTTTDPELVNLLIAATSVHPESLDAWTAVKDLVTDPTQASLDEESALVLLKNAGAVLADLDNSPLSKVILSVVFEGCIQELSNPLPVLLETNILLNLSRFLVPGIDTASVIYITDILICAAKQYSESTQSPELASLFNSYNLTILDLLSIDNELAQTQLLHLSRVIVNRIGVESPSDLPRFLSTYFEFTTVESTTLTDNALHSIATLLRRYPDLYTGVVQDEKMITTLIYYLNVESILSVKFAARSFLPIMAHACSLPPNVIESIAKRIQEAIALSSALIDYLIPILVAICESSCENCHLVCSLGIFESQKLTSHSYTATKAMISIYTAALNCNLLPYNPAYEPQIVANVTDSLESEEDSLILQTLDLCAALIARRYPLDIVDRVDELRLHETTEISEHAADGFATLTS